MASWWCFKITCWCIWELYMQWSPICRSLSLSPKKWVYLQFRKRPRCVSWRGGYLLSLRSISGDEFQYSNIFRKINNYEGGDKESQGQDLCLGWSLAFAFCQWKDSYKLKVWNIRTSKSEDQSTKRQKINIHSICESQDNSGRLIRLTCNTACCYDLGVEIHTLSLVQLVSEPNYCWDLGAYEGYVFKYHHFHIRSSSHILDSAYFSNKSFNFSPSMVWLLFRN